MREIGFSGYVIVVIIFKTVYSNKGFSAIIEILLILSEAVTL